MREIRDVNRDVGFERTLLPIPCFELSMRASFDIAVTIESNWSLAM